MIVLETKRLVLREMALDDVDRLYPLFSDPRAMQYYPQPFDRAATARWIAWNLRNYAEHGFGLWAVVDKAHGGVIGDCGLTIQTVDGVDELETK